MIWMTDCLTYRQIDRVPAHPWWKSRNWGSETEFEGPTHHTCIRAYSADWLVCIIMTLCSTRYVSIAARTIGGKNEK